MAAAVLTRRAFPGPAQTHHRQPRGVALGSLSKYPPAKPGALVCELGLIRSRGHFPKGGYDVPDGATNQESAPTPAV